MFGDRGGPRSFGLLICSSEHLSLSHTTELNQFLEILVSNSGKLSGLKGDAAGVQLSWDCLLCLGDNGAIREQGPVSCCEKRGRGLGFGPRNSHQE